jgi:hypothetical protein
MFKEKTELKRRRKKMLLLPVHSFDDSGQKIERD